MESTNMVTNLYVQSKLTNYQSNKSSCDQSIHDAVFKGLEKIHKIVEQWTQLYKNDLGKDVVFFKKNEISTLENLQGNDQKCFCQKEQWNEACLGKWRIISQKDKAYLVLNLIVGKGGRKEIKCGINLGNGEIVAVSQIQSNDMHFNSIKLIQNIFDKLLQLTEETHAPVCLIDLINFSYNDIKSQFIVQKFCVKGDLLSYMQSSEGQMMKPDLRKELACDFLRKLDFLNKNEILWVDIKPENLLIDEESKIKFTDFDSVRTLSGKAKKIEFFVSFPYLAPEIVISKNISWYDVRSEAWSAGLVLYYIFSGEIPKIVEKIKEKGSTFNFLASHFYVWIPLVSDTSSMGLKIVRNLLQPVANERWTVEEALKVIEKTESEDLIIKKELKETFSSLNS